MGKNTENFPIDIDDKSPEELTAIGFKSVGEVNVKLGENGEILDSDINVEKQNELRNLLQELKK